ncbi:MAG: PqqD family protein [Ignavibacteriales bacterium]|nr:MAG: PqqD family protein [Ignavibacteriales bacterium]
MSELSFSERKKILKNSNTLDMTPVKLHKEEVDEADLVTVLIPKFKNKFAVKFISPKLKSDVFRIKLDKLGSFVWMKMDGKNKVHQIVKEASEKFKDEIQPAEERVSKFLFQLYEQRLISFNELNR